MTGVQTCALPIFERFGLSGELPENLQMPVFADFREEVSDYHSAMNVLAKARDEFMTLPANLRARFENDPQRLMEFLGDDKNRDEAVSLGLVRPAPVSPGPLEVRVVPDPPPAA